MSLGLIKPGMRSANLAGKIHPKTGEELQPIGFLRDGTAVWPQMGAGPDDPDDPAYTGDDADEDDDEDEDDEEEDDKDKKKTKSSKTKKKTSTDDDEDEDDEDDKPTRPERQAAKYRTERNQARKELQEIREELRKIRNKDKPADEVVKGELEETKSELTKVRGEANTMRLELAFFKSNTIDWVDPADALRLVDLDDVDVDEDGTVDAKALRAALKDLAKRKPHLVKKAKAEPADDDDDEDEDDEEPSSRRSAPKLNGKRPGSRQTTDRAALAKRFPVLNR